jgi:hypothetical protein
MDYFAGDLELSGCFRGVRGSGSVKADAGLIAIGELDTKRQCTDLH